jgi:hypothetical protein
MYLNNNCQTGCFFGLNDSYCWIPDFTLLNPPTCCTGSGGYNGPCGKLKSQII